MNISPNTRLREAAIGIGRSKWMQQSERIKFRILVPLALALVVLLSAFIGFLNNDHRRIATRDTDISAQDVQKLLAVEEEQKAAVMATMLQALMNDDLLAQAMRVRDRDTLLERMKPLFESLHRRHKITHLYFHAPDRTNVLRVHQPDLHGDKIDRYTMLEAERTGQTASGIERGVTGTFTLRVVSPWRRNGQLLGYVELGVEFEEIVKDIHGLLNVDFVIAVYKKLLDREQWNKALASSGRQGRWDQFPATVVLDKTMGTIPQPVLEYLASARPEPSGSNHLVSWNGKDLGLAFLPLNDVTGKTIGELIVLNDITESMAQERASAWVITLLCLAVSAILFGLFYLFLTWVERDLAERTLKLKNANAELSEEIDFRENTQRDLAATHKQLIEASRQAGMAEIATNVLHNVGNILNSVNVSATLVSSTLRTSRARGLAQAIRLMDQHAADLGDFLTRDEKGKLLPGYLNGIARALAQEQQQMIEELAQLTNSVDHIKSVVSTQQSYAVGSSMIEPVQIRDLAEEALRLHGDSLARHHVTVVREFAPVPLVLVDRGRVLQILVNLISNAKQAMEGVQDAPRRLTLRVGVAAGSRLRIEVKDDGDGISAQNLTRIFAHGFTTRKTGHGFGLHSCALAARQMGGTLSAHSDGAGRGATFTLELPFDTARPPENHIERQLTGTTA
jgi:signal transduction histidine kinase